MASVPVPKDLSKVKSKVMFGLTKSQLVCFGGGALIGLPLFFLMRTFTGTSAATIVMILSMLPCFAFGMYEKDGQPLEAVLNNVVQTLFVRPKERPYKTDNFYAVLERQDKLDREVRNIVRKGRKNKKSKKRPAKKLTRNERKQITALVEQARRDKKGKPATAQQTIPYQIMGQDGICRVTDTRYTKTIQFLDINYLLSQDEDKNAIYDAWCHFINYFDSSVFFQFSFLNLSANMESMEHSISIPPRDDANDDVRREYVEMLLNQLARGNNGLVKTKYLTFGIEADSLKAAKPRLERMELDIINGFKRLGVMAFCLNGKERLHLLHSIYHMGGLDRFMFEWDWLPMSGLSTKDFVAPSSFEFKEGRRFRIGSKYAAVSFLQIQAPRLDDRMLADILDLENNIIVNLHVQSVDQNAAIKTLKRKITDLDSMKITEQKKAVRAGYDTDIIPTDLSTYGVDAKKLLEELQNQNERMFNLTFIILNVADTKQALDIMVGQVQSITVQKNCPLSRLDFQQEKGLASSLPLGLNQIEIQRTLTTSSTGILIPFTTQELFQRGPEALYYGLNALSNNLVMVDRKLLKNPKGLHCRGRFFDRKTQAGKPFAAQMDGQPPERNGVMNGYHASAIEKTFQKFAKKVPFYPCFFSH